MPEYRLCHVGACVVTVIVHLFCCLPVCRFVSSRRCRDRPTYARFHSATACSRPPALTQLSASGAGVAVPTSLLFFLPVLFRYCPRRSIARLSSSESQPVSDSPAISHERIKNSSYSILALHYRALSVRPQHPLRVNDPESGNDGIGSLYVVWIDKPPAPGSSQAR